MKWDKICIMAPTYGRAKTLLPKFISSCISTSSNKNSLRFAICVNEKDDATIRLLITHPMYLDGTMKIVYENLPSPNLAKYFNMLYEASEIFGDDCLVSMMGDDFLFKTQSWDIAVLDVVNRYDGIGVFYVNDDYIAHERCAVNMFVTRKMVEATEHNFMDEDFAADYIDYEWTKIGKYTKSLHYLPDVIIKHNHNTSKPKELWDDTFKRLNLIQNEAKKLGKPRAKESARRIADILIKKGFIGDNK